MRERDEVEREGEERGQEQGEPSRAVVLNLPSPETLKHSSSCDGTPNTKLFSCYFIIAILLLLLTVIYISLFSNGLR